MRIMMKKKGTGSRYASLLFTIKNPSSSGSYSQVAISNDNVIIGNPASNTVDIYGSSGNYLRTLTNPNDYGTSQGDQFGRGVSIEGNVALVVAPYEDGTDGISEGRGYTFNVSTGQLLATLHPPASAYNDITGYDSDISGGRVILSTPFRDVPINAAGAVHVYGAYGGRQRTLSSPNPTNAGNFGYNVSLSGTKALVGAPQETNTINQDGRAYIFDVSNGSLLHTLNTPSPFDTSRFGFIVDVSQTHAIVGDRSSNTFVFDTITGNLLYTIPTSYHDIVVSDTFLAGSNTIFGIVDVYDVTTGVLLYTIQNPNSYGLPDGDSFGYKLSISNDLLIAVAYGEDDANRENSGTAYIFKLR